MNPPDRPLRLEYLDAGELAANPLNPKFHPQEQLETLGEFMLDVGWAGALLYNERTGRLLDGHGRKQLYGGRGLMPVLVGSWDERQERKILAFLDSTGWMARVDSSQLDALLADGPDLLDGSSPRMGELLSAMKGAAELLTPEPDKPLVPTHTLHTDPPVDDGGDDPAGSGAVGAAEGVDETPRRPSAGETPDAIWPTDNPWGIPLLDLAMQADAVEFPVTLWGTQKQTLAMRGTWVFYAHDETFNTLWQNPGKVLPSGAPCLVEPNWSTHDQTPLALDLWGIYRRRWLARYWQSQGRRVFVDLNVHHRLLSDHEATPGFAPAFLGVPRGWRAFASRAHANRPEMLEAEYHAALKHSGCDSILFLVYGGGVRVQQLAREKGWAWVPEHNDTLRDTIIKGEPCPST